MSISDVITDLQSKALSLPGIKAAPQNPPESINVFPFAVSYLRTGNLELASSGWANYFKTIYTEIHVARQLLPAAIATALPYDESFPQKILADPTLSGTVTEVRAIRYTFGRLEWNRIETIGFRFEIDVKMDLISS